MPKSLLERARELIDNQIPRDAAAYVKFVERCRNEVVRLDEAETTPQKAKGHAQRIDDVLSALQQIQYDPVDIPQDALEALKRRLPVAEEMVDFATHPLTMSMHARRMKLAEAERTWNHQRNFWTGIESIEWLVKTNGWSTEFVIRYLEQFKEFVADEDADVIARGAQLAMQPQERR